MKKNGQLEKNYMYFNITFFLLAIYVIFFPLIAKVLNWISPVLTKCPYKEMTGNPCPLCGGTRYIARLSEVFQNPSMLLHPFGFIILFVIFNLIFRIFNIFYIKRGGKQIKKIMIADAIILGIAFLLFLIYEVTFMMH